MKYATPAAFKAALEGRLRAKCDDNHDLGRLRQLVVYDRIGREMGPTFFLFLFLLLTACVSQHSVSPSAARPDGSAWVRVPPGRFTLNASKLNARDVTVAKGFQLMRFEVTQAEFEAVMGFNPAAESSRTGPVGEPPKPCSDWNGVSLVDPRHPAMCVTFREAAEYANALSERDGLQPAYRFAEHAIVWDRQSVGYRLPTEAEWEHAARAGKSLTQGSTDEPHAVCETANGLDRDHEVRFGVAPMDNALPCSDGHAALAPVGRKRPNPWGLHDLSGNVFEWVWGTAARSWRSDPAAVVPPEAVFHGADVPFRGGSWMSPAPRTRVDARSSTGMETRWNIVGFRLARSITSGTP